MQVILNTVGGNSWGCPDKTLFEQVYQYIEGHPAQKTFHIILTTTNHPPYTIDVVSEGFDKKKVLQNLPDDIANDEGIINELGHIWYADMAMGKFVRKTEKIKTGYLVCSKPATMLNALLSVKTLTIKHSQPFLALFMDKV